MQVKFVASFLLLSLLLERALGQNYSPPRLFYGAPVHHQQQQQQQNYGAPAGVSQFSGVLSPPSIHSQTFYGAPVTPTEISITTSAPSIFTQVPSGFPPLGPTQQTVVQEEVVMMKQTSSSSSQAAEQKEEEEEARRRAKMRLDVSISQRDRQQQQQQAGVTQGGAGRQVIQASIRQRGRATTSRPSDSGFEERVVVERMRVRERQRVQAQAPAIEEETVTEEEEEQRTITEEEERVNTQSQSQSESESETERSQQERVGIGIRLRLANSGSSAGASSLCPSNNPERNKELVLRALREVFGSRDKSKLDPFFHEDYIKHKPLARDGLGPLQDVLESIRDPPGPSSRPFFKVKADGDLVWTYSRLVSGGRVFSSADIFRIECGKIKEHWDVHEESGVRVQILETK